jgi:tRNA(fMet)-specific endonuclease VapC
MSHLLDTNAVIARLNGEQAFEEFLRQSTTAIYIPSIVFGELYFGAENSTRVSENISKINQVALGVTILVADLDTAKVYAKVRIEQKKKGRPLNSDNDYWIAALAVQHRLTLVTRDQDFQAIGGMLIVGW